MRDHLYELYQALFQRPWPKWVGGLLLGILNVLMFAYLRPWGVFPQMALWGSWILNLLGIQTPPPFGKLVPPHIEVGTLLDVGIMMGVLMVALLSGEFKIRRDSLKGYAQGFLAGVIMGFGTVLTPPCNVGGFFSAISALSLSGFGMMAGLIPGAYLGGRILMWQAKRQVERLVVTEAQPLRHSQSRRPLAGLFVLLLLVAISAIYVNLGHSSLGIMFLFGAGFGIVLQRSRFCFAAAFRECFTTRNNETMRGIVIGLTIGIVGFAIIKANGFRPPDVYVFPMGWHTVVGGFIFGIGMVLASGCGTGILWRSAEGWVRMWFALIGGMFAAASWPLIYGYQVGQGWLYGPRIFLPNHLGWFGAIFLSLVVIWGWYLIVTHQEVKARRSTHVGQEG